VIASIGTDCRFEYQESVAAGRRGAVESRAVSAPFIPAYLPRIEPV
jgi:hypothetical protein